MYKKYILFFAFCCICSLVGVYTYFNARKQNALLLEVSITTNDTSQVEWHTILDSFNLIRFYIKNNFSLLKTNKEKQEEFFNKIITFLRQAETYKKNCTLSYQVATGKKDAFFNSNPTGSTVLIRGSISQESNDNNDWEKAENIVLESIKSHNTEQLINYLTQIKNLALQSSAISTSLGLYWSSKTNL